MLGLAPGRNGANRTGRVFTGDHAGNLLFATLLKFGFAEGEYSADPGDSLVLRHTMISNAVRCAPPENKPNPAEIRTCGRFLRERIASLPHLRVIVTLGGIAHEACLRALDLKARLAPFAHGASADLVSGQRKLRVVSSYHCSRYNTNTGILTAAMFESVFSSVRAFLDTEDSTSPV